MPGWGRRASWRGAALLPGATLMVHELRYLLAFGRAAGRELGERGDTYLGWLAPMCAVILAVPLGAVVGQASAAWRGRAPTGPAGGRGRGGGVGEWLLLGLVLVACFCGQELLEQVLEPDHPGGLSGVFGDGGWWALPAAFAVSGVLMLLMAGAGAAIGAIARWRRTESGRPGRRGAGARRWSAPALVSIGPLAGRAAGRAPPGGRVPAR